MALKQHAAVEKTHMGNASRLLSLFMFICFDSLCSGGVRQVSHLVSVHLITSVLFKTGRRSNVTAYLTASVVFLFKKKCNKDYDRVIKKIIWVMVPALMTSVIISCPILFFFSTFDVELLVVDELLLPPAQSLQRTLYLLSVVEIN